MGKLPRKSQVELYLAPTFPLSDLHDITSTVTLGTDTGKGDKKRQPSRIRTRKIRGPPLVALAIGGKWLGGNGVPSPGT